jgi:hypothetical protein
MSIIHRFERRRRRSDNAGSALGLQLEHTRSSGRLDALVLADAEGIVIAFAGDQDVCNALGALAPLGPRARTPACISELTGGDVAVRTLRSHGSPLFLAALGGTAARDALLASAASGVERILVAN